MAEITNKVITQFEIDASSLKVQNSLLSMTTKEIQKQIKASGELMNSQNKMLSMTTKSASTDMANSQKLQANRNKEIMQSVKISQQLQQERIYRNNANALMKESGLSSEKLSMGLKNMGIIMQKNGQLTDLFGNKLKKADINMQQLRKSAWRFNMNMLTLMFGFMALQRIVSQFGKSAITTYQKANEDTQGLGKSTWHLQAAWEFFKYSLVDALTQSPLFQMFVEWLIKIVQWFNKLSPTVKSWIAIAIAIIFVIATVSVLYSTLQPLISLLTVGGITGAIKSVGLLAGKFLLWAALIYFVWKLLSGLFTGWNKGSKEAEKSSMSLSKIIGFLAQTFIFLGKLVNLGAQIIGMSLANMKDGFIILAKSVQLSFAMTFNAVLNNFESMINTIIGGINSAIRGLQKLGVRVSTIPTFKTGLQIDTQGIANEIAALQRQIQNRGMALALDTPTIAEMWASSDMSRLVAPSTSNNVVTNNQLSIGEINLSGVSEDIMANTDKLTEQISKEVMDKISEQLNRKNDSAMS